MNLDDMDSLVDETFPDHRFIAFRAGDIRALMAVARAAQEILDVGFETSDSECYFCSAEVTSSDQGLIADHYPSCPRAALVLALAALEASS